MLGKISHYKEDLNRIHQKYPWIPNENQIRPKNVKIMEKNHTISMIENQWKSIADYIKHTVFGLSFTVDYPSYKFYVQENPTWIVFQKAEFPYQLEDEGQHFILWYPLRERVVSDNNIDIDIQNCIHKFYNGDYNYAWYINPKMTIPAYFHVQVFVKFYN